MPPFPRRLESKFTALDIAPTTDTGAFEGYAALFSREDLGRDVFSRGSDPAAGHVGFCLADLGTRLAILGGNQSDAVTVELMPRSRLLSLRWPATLPSTAPTPSAASPTPSRPSDPLFEHCLAHVLRIEGGYGHDPYDPGGPTNLGITLATLAAWRNQPLTEQSHPDLLAALQSLSVTEAGAIYHARYWVPSLASRLPQPLAVMHFDAAVNHGVTGAARLLQTALGVDVDGEIGPVTLRAANSGDVRSHLAAYAEARRIRYRALPHFWRFGRGWLARVDTTLAAALRMPMPSPAPQPKRKDKSMSQPISDSEPKWWGHSLTIWGAIITTLSTVLPAIGPLFGLDVTAELVRQLGAAIAQAVEAIGGVVGIALTIFGRIRAVQPLTRRPVSLKV